MIQNQNDLTEKQLREFRAGRYGSKTSKTDLLLHLDFTTHQANELLHALHDIVDSYDRDEGSMAGALMVVAIAHAQYVVAKAKVGEKI
jgi:hypothetical protein